MALKSLPKTALPMTNCGLKFDICNVGPEEKAQLSASKALEAFGFQTNTFLCSRRVSRVAMVPKSQMNSQ